MTKAEDRKRAEEIVAQVLAPGQPAERRFLIDAITAFAEEVRREQKWQPIESAPRDGTRVLLRFAEIDVYIGYFYARPLGSGRWLTDSGEEFYNTPTGWMALPPKEQ